MFDDPGKAAAFLPMILLEQYCDDNQEERSFADGVLLMMGVCVCCCCCRRRWLLRNPSEDRKLENVTLSNRVNSIKFRD